MRTIKEILDQHKEWTYDNKKGKRLVWSKLTEKEQTNFRYANLEYAYLEKALLKGANLYRAYLKNACLKYANLENANLQEANLKYTELLGANFKGADIEKTIIELGYDDDIKTLAPYLIKKLKELGKIK